MATLTLRQTKGSPLTNAELDNNFSSLNNAKAELAGDLGGSTSTPLVVKLYNRALSSSAPLTGQSLIWDGSTWSPGVGALTTSTVTVSSTVTSTVATTQNFPYAFSAFADGSFLQTITPGSQQKVYFQQTEFNVGSFYSSGTSRFKPQVEGYYQLNSEVRFDANVGTGSELMIAIWKNGAEYKRGWNSVGVIPGTNWFAMQIGSLMYFNGSTDYAEIYVQHGSTSNVTITGVSSTGITWFNGVMIPKMVSTSLSVTSTVSSNSNVTSYGGANTVVNQVMNDISHQFDSRKQVFNLRSLNGALISGTEYTDSSDLEVVLDGRQLEPWIYDANRWGPWQNEYDAGRTNSYRIRGNKIIFYKQPRQKTTGFIKINTKSIARQTRKYPLLPNNIVFGD